MNVMRNRRAIIVVLSVGVFALASLALLRPRPLIAAKLLRVQGFPEASRTNANHPSPCYMFRLTKPDAPLIEFAEEQVIQYRIGGKWLPPEKYNGPFTMADTFPECGQLGTILNRRGAEAFRVYLAYRRQSPRDEAEARLAGSRWAGKVPRWIWEVVARLPKESKWRHTVIEFELPKQPWWLTPGYETAHNESRQPKPDERVGYGRVNSLRLPCRL
jgi:hypothetical protein